MKAIKTLLAVSVLAAAGAANAAVIATGSLTASSALTGISSYTGTGTISLDDSGTLTLNHSGISTVLGANTMSMDYSDILTGTIADGVFTATGGHTHLNSCTPVSGTDYCSFASNPQENTFNSVTGGPLSISLGASANFTGTYTSAAGATPVNYAISAVVPTAVSEVPVPAAAWLFGSGLLGLAGTARRRRNAV